ncbi:MAG TPA: DUF5752 family protein [Candidatus Hydrothermia bacterium]|nr:hypothetical protein [Candidatus Hydrothermae bacterium]MDD5572228.1 DUF5752 family protein [Candidatus Hydrothermia bacterium]HOK22492.1 DUF5752 family protein [Candidatus Hydrothermia bacterium]HOL23199.1 DUF5752 family protein [Candidatus Hydrothermia bacterium]HOP32615.1 DUF5752 family protein [Candidatus Hydrothermia bacterium]
MNPFVFYTKLNLTFLTNVRARNIVELLEGLKISPDSVIYHHTHRFLQQHVYISPEPPNDFAFWTQNTLHESILAERLEAINIIEFKTLAELKERLIKTIEDYLKEGPEIRNAPPGMEFHFMKSKSFVIKTGFNASNLLEFYETLKIVDIQTLYFHMFEARMRMGKGDNDFSIWLRNTLGEKEIADAISKLDPYTVTLEGLRKNILNIIEERIHEKD